MRALDGIRVVDLSRLYPGPMCTWYLQGLGAEIIKVEDPVTGDYMRHAPPFDENGVGVWFGALNAGKKSVGLDLRTPAGQEALCALLSDADVLVESFRPGVMDRFGLSASSLQERFPRLVIASITGFGQTGSHRDLPGHDLGYCGLAGALSMAVRRDGVPDVPGIQAADVGGGALTAALSIVSALFKREKTGAGDWLDVSMTEGVMALSILGVAATAAGSRPLPGAEPLTGGLGAYQLYRCSDGKMLSLAALEPKFWQIFCEKVGRAMSMDRAEIAALFATRPRDEWGELLAEACVVPVLELDEVISHPLHRERGIIVGEGSRARVRPPFPGAEKEVHEPVASLGQHTAQVLEAVGYDVSQLRQGGQAE